MDDTEHQQRIDRRHRVVALIKAMANNEPDVDRLVGDLAADADLKRVVGALGVAGSTLAKSLSQVSNRSVDDVIGELDEGMASAPVD
jgi:hypothetical protein